MSSGMSPLWLAALAAALLPPAAQAGRAQVGIQMGTYATADMDGASASGKSWRDGLLLQQLTDAAALPDKDWASLDLRVDSGPRNSSAQAEMQAQARLRSNGAAFAGAGRVASDVTAGTLALQWRSNLVQDPDTPREGFVRGYAFTELWETFEVVYPITRVTPIEVMLSLQLTGQLAGTDPADPLRPGVEAYLSLGGVATGDSHHPLDPVWRSEASVTDSQISYSGPLQSIGCSAARGVCSGFVSLYAALDLRGRVAGVLADAWDAWQPVRAPVDLAFTGQLSLRVSDGVTLVRGDVSDVLPAVDWAQVSSVPEPGSWALFGVGLLGMRSLVRRRAVKD